MDMLPLYIMFLGIFIMGFFTIFRALIYDKIIRHIKLNHKEISNKFNNFKWYPFTKYPKLFWSISFTNKYKLDSFLTKKIKIFGFCWIMAIIGLTIMVIGVILLIVR